MEHVASKEEARQAVAAAVREGKRVGLVPTMGALHEGHLSLVRTSVNRADYTVVSIFVNPTQFGEGEDFDAYPRTMEMDISLLAAEGADLVFAPSMGVMYDARAQVTVDAGPMATMWEGASRPTHFAGVCTIVSKLLNIICPHLAFFGEKDYQQLRMIERMVRDLDHAVTVVGCPIVRERDGLAMSSRNVYLTPAQRSQAIALSEALEAAANAVAWGERDVATIERSMAEELSSRPLVDVDYARVVDSVTLEPLSELGVAGSGEGRAAVRGTARARAIVAATVGTTRLLDNAELVVPAETMPV